MVSEVDKDCCYCAEEKAQVKIMNPNFDSIDYWDVCRVCEKIIKNQMDLSFGMILQTRGNPIAEKMSNEMIKLAENNLKEIAYESGKEIFSIELRNSGEESK